MKREVLFVVKLSIDVTPVQYGMEAQTFIDSICEVTGYHVYM